MQRKSMKYYLSVFWGIKKMGCKRERSKQVKGWTLVVLRLSETVIFETVQVATGKAYKFRAIS